MNQYIFPRIGKKSLGLIFPRTIDLCPIPVQKCLDESQATGREMGDLLGRSVICYWVLVIGEK